MARVTVEDCLKHVDNRFNLVLLASKRARQISMGARALVGHEDKGKPDKPTVLALREIAEGKISTDLSAKSNEHKYINSIKSRIR